MAIEALALVRGLFESIFPLAGIMRGTLSPEQLLSHDLASRRKGAKGLAPVAARFGASDKSERLANFARRHTAAKEVQFIDMARAAGLEDVYNGSYRLLSHYAAHPSLSAIEVFMVERTDGGRSVELRPALDRTPAALLLGTVGILMATAVFEGPGSSNTTLTINRRVNDALNRHGELEQRYDIVL